MSSPSLKQQSHVLPAATSVGSVRLRVASLDRSLAFYVDTLGFEAVRNGDVASLAAAGGPTLVELREVPGLQRAPANAAGMYHFAILLPSRPDLARFVRHLAEQRVPFGQSDHTVSEALYFDDPDGNGIEVYADRDRATWPVDDGIVRFTGDPIDFDDLLGEIKDSSIWAGMPAGTAIGHVHLRVADVERAEAFFVQLGFEVTADFVRGASFVSAGGYHHHIGMNMWQSRGRPLAGADVSGLDAFTIVLPDEQSWRDAIERLGDTASSGHVFHALTPDGTAFDLVYPE